MMLPMLIGTDRAWLAVKSCHKMCRVCERATRGKWRSYADWILVE